MRRHPAAVLLAFSALITGTVLTAVPESVLPGVFLLDQYVAHVNDVLWPLMYGLGGWAGLLGIWFGKPQIEAAGFTLLAFSLAFYIFVFVAVLGASTTLIPVTVLAAAALGAGLHALSIVRAGAGK